jgi:hypothetical protein
MSEREDKGELSVVFRFREDVLDFFFMKGKSWVYFDLRGFDTFGRVRRKPAAVDAKLEERAEVAKFFGRSERGEMPRASKITERICVEIRTSHDAAIFSESIESAFERSILAKSVSAEIPRLAILDERGECVLDRDTFQFFWLVAMFELLNCLECFIPVAGMERPAIGFAVEDVRGPELTSTLA